MIRWLKDYCGFASRLLKDEGASKERTNVSVCDLLAHEETLEVFIGWLALKKVGFSVPRSARRFLLAARMRLGFRSLNEIASVGDIIRGHERSTPRNPKKTESLEVDDVNRIAEVYGKSSDWWLL